MSGITERYKGVYIEWIDHHGENGWHEIDKLGSHQAVVHSIGYVVKETDEYVTIARCISEDTGTNSDMCNDTLSVMKNCIIHRKEVVVRRKRGEAQAKEE